MLNKPRLVLGIQTLCHATTLDQAHNILGKGVQPRYQKPGRRLDFGPGFYMTSQMDQATEFALLKQELRDGTFASVLEYHIPSDFWAGLRGIEFPLWGDATWKKFVMGHRSGSWSVEEGLDYVYGPVADNLRLMKTAGALPTPIRPYGQDFYDQVSFHSFEAADRLDSLVERGGCYLWVAASDMWRRQRLIRT